VGVLVVEITLVALAVLVEERLRRGPQQTVLVVWEQPVKVLTAD
jgi:hypothetical protein